MAGPKTDRRRLVPPVCRQNIQASLARESDPIRRIRSFQQRGLACRKQRRPLPGRMISGLDEAALCR
jgi:hypothetical protein